MLAISFKIAYIRLKNRKYKLLFLTFFRKRIR